MCVCGGGGRGAGWLGMSARTRALFVCFIVYAFRLVTFCPFSSLIRLSELNRWNLVDLGTAGALKDLEIIPRQLVS